jgi:hypothetical protein
MENFWDWRIYLFTPDANWMERKDFLISIAPRLSNRKGDLIL